MDELELFPLKPFFYELLPVEKCYGAVSWYFHLFFSESLLLFFRMFLTLLLLIFAYYHLIILFGYTQINYEETKIPRLKFT